jgi:FAD-linked oxidoreductase
MLDRHRWRNWGRNQSCTPAAIEEPRSELEVAEAVERARAAGQTVKVVGTGHSFTDIACTDGRMLSIDALDRVLGVDEEACTVTVEAGITINRLNSELAERGLALANLGDIDRQTLAGATSTGTHGTGRTFGGLATFITGMELVTADGELLACSPDEEPEVFHSARVGLGALGVVTKLTLQCVPAFNLHHVERPKRLPDLLAELDAAVDANEHFEFYWLPHTDTCSMIANNRTDEPAQPKSAYKTWRAEIFYPNYVFGAFVAAGRLAPSKVTRIADIVAGTVGATDFVNRSDLVLVSTRMLRFAEMEYSIPRAHAVEAVLAVRDMIDDGGHRVSFPIEVRFVAGDDIPLSMAFGRECCFVAVLMKKGVAYVDFFGAVEQIMNRFEGRPHWGKVHFQTAATLEPRYPEWDRFRSVRARLDPEGRFANAYLDRVLGDRSQRTAAIEI